jgi:hypothetical protein
MTEMLKGSKAVTMSMKPMCSTGMTGQSSNLGIWVSPNTYLQVHKHSSWDFARCKLNKQFQSQCPINCIQENGVKKVPQNNVGFLQGPILLDPCRQTLVNSRILVGKLSSREHLVALVLCDPEIVLQEPSPPQKFRLRQSQRQAV